MLNKWRFHNVREAFLRYVLKIDSGRLGIPPGALYSQIELARGQIEVLTTAGRRSRSMLTVVWTRTDLGGGGL